MEKKKEKNDGMGYIEAIKKAFPAALITKCDNFDDSHWGYEICPTPSKYIRFNISFNNPLYIWIHYTQITSVYSDDNTKTKTLFRGILPADSNLEPDLELITKILKNHQNIG